MWPHAFSEEEAAFRIERALRRGAKAVLLVPSFQSRGAGVAGDALFAWPKNDLRAVALVQAIMAQATMSRLESIGDIPPVERMGRDARDHARPLAPA